MVEGRDSWAAAGAAALGRQQGRRRDPPPPARTPPPLPQVLATIHRAESNRLDKARNILAILATNTRRTKARRRQP